jgi:hypothetical protein
MAKAKEIAEIDCDANVLEWAAIVLHVRFGEVLEFRGAALHSENIKGVHDMRVATRRLRSALRDFAHLLKKNSLNGNLRRNPDGKSAFAAKTLFVSRALSGN